MKEKLSLDDLSAEQLRAIEAIVEWFKFVDANPENTKLRPCFKLSGPAGSGKSTIVQFALEKCGLSLSDTSIVKVAFAGKAVEVMRQKSLTGAMTIHKAIYSPIRDREILLKKTRAQLSSLRAELSNLRAGTFGGLTTEEVSTQEAILVRSIENCVASIKTTERSLDKGDSVDFALNPIGPAASGRLIVCDEGSMVDGKMKRDLESFNVPVLYLGDLFQIPPIDNSSPESVFFDRNGLPLKVDFALTEVHRQAEGSPIILMATALRLGTNPLNFVGKRIGTNGSLFRVPMERLTDSNITRAEQIIVGYNNTRRAVNMQVREIQNRTSQLPESGEKLICLKNHASSGLCNGSIVFASSNAGRLDQNGTFSVGLETQESNGERVPVYDEKSGDDVHSIMGGHFLYPGDDAAMRERIPYHIRKERLHLDFAYAITGHKAQGSQYRSGILVEEPLGKTEEMRRRWLYTGLTRFSHTCVMAF